MLQVKNLTKIYQYKPALKDLTITIEKGKLYGLIGNNGAGKTTLLNLLAYQDKPTFGTIEFEGHALCEQDLQEISYFMDHSLFSNKERIKDIFYQYRYFFENFNAERAMEIVTAMKVDQNDKLGKMSTGERKKCELAFVLSRDAKLYFLDEPFANLDPLVRSEIMEMIVRYAKPDASYIISTHQVQEIESYIDETILIKDGVLLVNGSNDVLREQYHCSIAALLLDKLKEK